MMDARFLGRRTASVIARVRRNPVMALLWLLVAMQALTLWFAVWASTNADQAAVRADDAHVAARSAYMFAEQAAHSADDAAGYAEDASDRIRRLIP